MDTPPPLPPSPPRVYIEDVISDFRYWLRRASNECSAAVREHPGQSLFAAFALGAFTRHLPLPAIITTGLRTALAATPPALALIGARVLAEYCRRQEGACHPAARPPRSMERLGPDEFPLEGDGHTVIPDPSPPLPAPPGGSIT